MKERELLEALYNFIVTKQIVQGDVESLRDMATRYKSPPISMAFPVALRMTVQDSYTLNDLLSKAIVLLASTEVTPLYTPKVEGVVYDKTPLPSNEWLEADYDKNLKGNFDDNPT